MESYKEIAQVKLPPNLLPGRTIDPVRTVTISVTGDYMAPLIQEDDLVIVEFGAEVGPGIFAFEMDGVVMVMIS